MKMGSDVRFLLTTCTHTDITLYHVEIVSPTRGKKSNAMCA